jgi:hypothetical protein
MNTHPTCVQICALHVLHRRWWYITLEVRNNNNNMMRSSPLANLIFIGYVFFPKAALGALVPVFVYRDPPTSSQTSSPSYQPPLRQSLEPSSQPSSQPTSNPSSSPSTQPSLSVQPSSLSISSSYMMSSEATSKPSSYGFWLVTSVIVAILLFIGALELVRKKKNKQCLPCFVVRGAKISEDKMQMQDKVQQKQNETLPLPPTPAEAGAQGEQDGWAVLFSPVLALGEFFSSMVSPVPPQEELSPKEPSNLVTSLSSLESSESWSQGSNLTFASVKVETIFKP